MQGSFQESLSAIDWAKSSLIAAKVTHSCRVIAFRISRSSKGDHQAAGAMGHAWDMRFSHAPSCTENVCRQRFQRSCSSRYAQCMRPSVVSHHRPWASTAAASRDGARALRLSQGSARQQRGRNSLTTVRAADDDAEYIERPPPVRRSVSPKISCSATAACLPSLCQPGCCSQEE